jgi:hypothetical protein
MSRNGRPNDNGGMLLIARDSGAPANPSYTVAAAASGSNVTVEAKMIVISGLGSAFLDGAGVAALGTTATALGPLSATLPSLGAGASNFAIAATQYDNTVNAARTIAVAAEGITQSATLGSAKQTSNPYQFSLCATGVGQECTDFAAGLLWRQTLSAASPTFDVQTAASAAASVSGEAKILAAHMSPVTDVVEIIP